MKVLGISSGKGSGAAIMEDGKIIAAASEERFSRIKNDAAFPYKSLEFVLKFSNTKLSDIEHIGVGCLHGVFQDYLPTVLDDIFNYLENDPSSHTNVRKKLVNSMKRDLIFRDEFIEKMVSLGFDSKDITFYEHHTSHASTAFECSPFDEALVITLDGRGDLKSGTISHATRKSGLKLLTSNNMLDSVGVFYGFITNFLGFKPNRHEGKVTGLAAYGDPKKALHIMKKMISYKNGRIFGNHGKNFTAWNTGAIPEIEEELKNFSKEDISAAAQYWMEEIVKKFIDNYLQKYKVGNICLAGGIFANVKLNQRIREMDLVDNVFIFPGMTDVGNSIGGAFLKSIEIGQKIQYPIRDVYWGPEYTDEMVENSLKAFSDEINYEKVNEAKIKMAAESLASDKVVGWFQGRMEYGPRALGTRSILVNATNNEINKTINDRLQRTEFMPFAPVTLFEFAEKSYVDWHESHICNNFMTMCYDTTDFMKETPAVVHVDGTARPQVIRRKDNREYYDVIKEYYEITGIPTIVNTSFNNHEEPIICSPTDAIKSLIRDNVDELYIGNYYVVVNK